MEYKWIQLLNTQRYKCSAKNHTNLQYRRVNKRQFHQFILAMSTNMLMLVMPLGRTHALIHA